MDRLTGRKIGLQLIAEVGIAHSQVAQRITWHSHAGHQLLFVLGGATTYEFKQPGASPRLNLSGEHFAIIPPGVVHRGVQDMRPPCDLLYVVMTAGARNSCRNTPFTQAEWRWIGRHFRQARLVAYSLNEELRRAVTLLAAEVNAVTRRSQTPLLQARLRTMVCEVLLEATEQLTATAASLPGAEVVAAEQFLRKHSDEQLRMSDVAGHLRMSRARLFDLFKRGTGMTPNDYLLRVRIEKARELLANPDCSVTDVAFDTGFASSQYFSTVFRKYTGLTPREYRRSLGRVEIQNGPTKGK